MIFLLHPLVRLFCSLIHIGDITVICGSWRVRGLVSKLSQIMIRAAVVPSVFHGSPFIELLSPQGSKPLEHWQITSGASTLACAAAGAGKKQTHSSADQHRIYERDIKGFCFVCKGTTRLQFPSPSSNLKTSCKGSYYIY